MEKTDDHIGMLVGLYIAYPFLGSGYHILEAQSTPKILREPVGDGGREHTEDGDSHSSALDDGVGLQIGIARLGVDDVGSEQRKVECLMPGIIDGMARLHVVVADGLGVILQIFAHLCGDVGLCSVDKVGIVGQRLSLQDVAIVEQHHVAAGLAQGIYISAHPCHRPILWLKGRVVVGEEATMHIAGLYNVDFHCLGFCH